MHLMHGQASFKSMVPQQPVVEGESFRIQYVITDASTINNFSPPSFTGFRVVSGPEVYGGQATTGLSSKPIRNLIYTLQATAPGQYFLQGATAVINGKTSRSNDVLVKVISRNEATHQKRISDSQVENDHTGYLRPGEDPYEKIRKNLFIKVMLDKRSCYPGEPVVATFKLYSRLQSLSDIIKNPGFYGFAVQDMINIDDHVMNTEKVNGKLFYVHTVRKVQLYPLQEGVYTVDAMEVKNRVEFSRSMVNRKTEQEIIEGVFEDDDPEPLPGIEVFETHISTPPLAVTVRPLPARNRPMGFNDATGRFRIEAQLEKKALSRNEEGYLVVTIKGKGNFHQVSAPPVDWPDGIEAFEPTVSDTLDKSAVPLEGKRTYRFPFVISQPGDYFLPGVSFSFFDPDSNKYNSETSAPLKLTVSHIEKSKAIMPTERKKSISEVNRNASRIAGIIVFGLIAAALSFWILRGKPRVQPAQVLAATVSPTPEDVLRNAYILIPAADRDFYTELHRSLWEWLGREFQLSGTLLGKQELAGKMKAVGISEVLINSLLWVLEHCEKGRYTNVSLGEDREELLEGTRSLIGEIRKWKGQS